MENGLAVKVLLPGGLRDLRAAGPAERAVLGLEAEVAVEDALRGAGRRVAGSRGRSKRRTLTWDWTSSVGCAWVPGVKLERLLMGAKELRWLSSCEL